MTLHLSAPTDPLQEFHLNRHFLMAGALAFALIGVIGGWASTARLDAAVIASGQVKVETEIKTVQHADGGRVAEILVKPGDLVTAGQVIMRLDMQDVVAELDLRRAQLAEQIAKAARLRAEVQGQDAPLVPPGFAEIHPDAMAMLGGEALLLTATRQDREATRQSLQLQLAQLDAERSTLNARTTASAEALDNARRNADRAVTLFAKGAIPEAKLQDANTELARLKADAVDLQSNLILNASKHDTTRIELQRLDTGAALDAQRQVLDVQQKVTELTETVHLLEMRIARGEIRAPSAGRVNELPVNTIGQVISAGGTLATIVPQDQDLVFEFHVSPQDIDELSTGQALRLRFTAFDRRTSPELGGTITRLAPAATVDQSTGHSYYLATARLSPGESLPQDEVLVPGMPVEVHVPLHDRTAIEYLLQPVTDTLHRAMTEK